MSAFLYFSQGKRAQIKAEHPELKNTDISRILGGLWRNAPPEERAPHIEKEHTERQKYKVAIAAWRKEQDDRIAAKRKEQADLAAEAQAQLFSDPYLSGQNNSTVINSFLLQQTYPIARKSLYS